VKGFLLGFLTASALCAGLYVWRLRPPPPPAPAASTPDAGALSTSDKRHRHRNAGRGQAAPPLHPGDLRPQAEGDDLSTPDVINAGEPGGEAELSQEQLDERFQPHQAEILACIDKARPSPDAPVVGKVVVRFRVQRTGAVRGVRVEAPNVLMAAGLYRCIRPIVAGVHFPGSGRSLVVTYPFQLE
jgi:hypothetical protein